MRIGDRAAVTLMPLCLDDCLFPSCPQTIGAYAAGLARRGYDRRPAAPRGEWTRHCTKLSRMIRPRSATYP